MQLVYLLGAHAYVYGKAESLLAGADDDLDLFSSDIEEDGDKLSDDKVAADDV